jgi:cysteine desulfuration protein SufE
VDADELIDNFDLFDDWEDRYAYLIDLGRKLPEMPPELKTDDSKVEGCLSQVWFVRTEPDSGRLHWLGDSDSSIVKGLIAVLQVLYAGKTPEEVAAVDIDGIFGQIGLERHLSMNRRNGFFAMVQRLRDFAAA